MWLLKMHNNFWYSLVTLGAICLSGICSADDFNPSGVIVESLPELTLNTVGTEKTTNPALWSGTPVETMMSLLTQVEQAGLSPAQRRFVGRLLTLDTAGSGLNDANRVFGETTFLEKRLSALFQMGEWDDVLKMLALVSENDMTTELKKIKINTLLMKGDVQQACALAGELESDTYVDKINISCFLAKEEKEKAVLAYDIFQEDTPETDTVFTALAENALREIPTDLPVDAVLDVTDVYLFSLNKNAQINWDKQSRAVKMTIADLPTTDIPLRIEIGEKSGLSLDEMKKLYRLPLFNPDLNNPVIHRAYLHQRILTSVDEKQKVLLLKEFIDSAKKDKLFINLAPVIADVLNTIEADEEYIDIAFDAVQAYALTDNLALSEPWFDVLLDGELPIYQKQVFLLIPLRQMMGAGYPYDLKEKMKQYCGSDPIPECEKIKLFVTPADYSFDAVNVENEEISDKNLSSESDEKRTTRLGEALLSAILDIHNGQNLKESYHFIKEVGQRGLREAVLKEGMIFE